MHGQNHIKYFVSFNFRLYFPLYTVFYSDLVSLGLSMLSRTSLDELNHHHHIRYTCFILW